MLGGIVAGAISVFVTAAEELSATLVLLASSQQAVVGGHEGSRSKITGMAVTAKPRRRRLPRAKAVAGGQAPSKQRTSASALVDIVCGSKAD